jgi:hypothetical protein
MNLLSKLRRSIDLTEDFEEKDAEFLRRVIEGEINFEAEEFDSSPCHGSLELGDHCKGCKFEKDHIG